MIKRISQANTPENVYTTRPDPKDDRNLMLFHKRPSLRRLIVLVDNSLIENSEDDFELGLLMKLLKHPYIDVYKYSDDGPPSEAEKVEHKLSKYPGYVGWAVIYKDENPISVIASLKSGSISVSGIVGDLHTLALDDTATSAYSGLSDGKASEQRYNDALAVRVAQYVNADIFITDRSYLFETQLPIVRNVSILNPKDALPLVGLYLRTQGEYFLDEDNGVTLTTSRQDFYWVGAHELLTQSWRLNSATMQYSEATSDNKLSMLEGSIEYRICRVLQARDGVHIAINDINSDESLISQLDQVLINLEGSMDASAKIAHFVFGISFRGYPVWQNDRWLSNFSAGNHKITDLVSEGSEGKKLIKLLIALRNTIHGESLHSIRTISDMVTRHIDVQVMLPSDKQQEIIDAAESLGGLSEWGITQKGSVYFINPDNLVDKLVPAVVALLDSIIEKIPFEEMDEVALSDEDVIAPQKSELSIFMESSRKNVLSQLGLS